jgi:hypothetical protein
MKRNMCALCRILHNPIVISKSMVMGEHPSLLSGCASTIVYVRVVADGWIFLRSYLGFSYVPTKSCESIYNTSITEVVDIPCRNSPYYMAYTRTCIFEPSVYLSGCKIE